MERVAAPLIKWPGGKSREISNISDRIPLFDRYFEPFFGGGALFFHLKPKKAILNDSCKELIDFYRFIKGEFDNNEFKKYLLSYATYWEEFGSLISDFQAPILNIYRNDYDVNEVKNLILSKKSIFSLPDSFLIYPKNFLGQIVESLIVKLERTKELEKKRGKISTEDLKKNIETGFRSGFYIHFRDIFNRSRDLSQAHKIANYYFVREFCYGAMFRYNADGGFNIPYGGIAYNRKNFRQKVEYILSAAVQECFSGTTLYNEDFEQVLKKFPLSDKDFLFLDPPYDSDFKDYENQPFSSEDQRRLSRFLAATKAKFILVIKKTPFIKSLYDNQTNIFIDQFEKKYQYNVRGRNQRETEHLIISNMKS